ncbi:MFS transporter [Mycobacterium angelicum]|nr:MFS transporter [Mycobacterium angelicum]
MTAPAVNVGPPRGMLALLTAASFLVFVQIFVVAPILPALAHEFATTSTVVGLAVPAFLLPYGVMVLVWGTFSDRWGRRPVILCCMVLFAILTAVTPLVEDAAGFIGVRLAAGVGSSGVVPIGLALIGDLVPYQRRGRALGWMFGGMAGGMAFGAAGGALGEPVLGWEGLFGVVSVVAVVLFVAALRLIPGATGPRTSLPARQLVAGYVSLLRNSRARRTYLYVLINAVLHAGIYTWLGVYLYRHFHLDETQIGLVLLGYGIPGLLLGPVIGHWADRHGRALIIPPGLVMAAACAALLALEPPLAVVQVAIIALSLGYDMTQPPLAGIVTDLPGNRGQAIGLNACTLFVGMGLGSLAFRAVLLPAGFAAAFWVFAGVALLFGLAAVRLFRAERPALKVTVIGHVFG